MRQKKLWMIAAILVISGATVLTAKGGEYVEKQVEGNPNFEVIDIGKHVRNLKQFLKLRDTNPAFDEAKAVDDLGIPCYVLEDGSVTLYSKDVGLEPRPQDEGATCSIDGRGC